MREFREVLGSIIVSKKTDVLERDAGKIRDPSAHGKRMPG